MAWEGEKKGWCWGGVGVLPVKAAWDRKMAKLSAVFVG